MIDSLVTDQAVSHVKYARFHGQHWVSITQICTPSKSVFLALKCAKREIASSVDIQCPAYRILMLVPGWGLLEGGFVLQNSIEAISPSICARGALERSQSFQLRWQFLQPRKGTIRKSPRCGSYCAVPKQAAHTVQYLSRRWYLRSRTACGC